jgi:Zn-dependent M28 family amino/carboxypeptidase
MSSSFNEQKLREQIKYLSSDELEGRGPGGKGGQMAAEYIADQLKASGVQGGGPGGSYFQQVKLFGVKSDPSTTLSISSKDKNESFKFADEFVAFTGAQKSEVDIDAEIVFVGFGIDAPKYRWNDYKGTPSDFKNKVLLIMVNDPPATKEEPDLFTGRALTYYGRWTYKFEEAARRGAAGVILIHTDESAGYPWSVVRTSNGNWRYDVARKAGDKTPFLKMRSWVTQDSAKRLLGLAGKDLLELQKSATKRDFKPVNLGLRSKINIKSEIKEFDSPNVVGILPGTDPKLRDEYVIYTSHWDHLGVGEPDKRGDRIYNGAADNASGVACVLAIADVLAKMPAMKRPKRSSLFLFTTAEEQGLLGAEYYTQYPLVPLSKTAANINLDVVNMYDRVMDFTPLGAERSTLMDVAKQVAHERGLTITPEQRPEQGSFYRSDHFPFAKVGVPCVSLQYGKIFPNKPVSFGEEMFRQYNTQRYHQPSDEYNDSWNMNGIIQEGEIALAMGLIIGNAAEMPRYNPNDEFAIKRR